MWFTNDSNNSIGRITTAGVVTNYTSSSIRNPNAIAAGPDGALWFTNSGNDSIGRITTGRSEPPAIISSDSASATAGSGFTFTVSTTGSSVPAITETGTLPTGLTFLNNDNGTATVSGSPGASGVYRLTITATFGKGKAEHVVTQAFTLTVGPA
jgi:sugar lactone lactonase YvrE